MGHKTRKGILREDKKMIREVGSGEGNRDKGNRKSEGSLMGTKEKQLGRGMVRDIGQGRNWGACIKIKSHMNEDVMMQQITLCAKLTN